ncbi:family 20 glycosylhydrolase [Paraburkholderia sp. Se-20369]|nr:family 20 glycosylhydrolase [Paraburkholderia sp. Se-20369]
MCGAEPHLYENLATFCEQRHPRYEVLFGVASASDPAVAVVERLRADYPERDITLVIDARVYGKNLKVSNLINLADRAKYGRIVIADSDIAVKPDYLERVTAPLADESVGVVTCLYHARSVGGFWTRIGAQFVDAWFAPSVRITHLGRSSRFGFGATLALTRDTLDRSGGGYLTRDDYMALLRYAADRFVEVIPEIDMPAHSRAAVVSMEARYRRLHAAGREQEANAYRLLDPQDTSNLTTVQFYDRRSDLNPCVPGALNFATKVIREIASMHTDARVPLRTWHYGGDEAKNILLGAGFQPLNGADPGKGRVDLAAQDKPWARSPACTALLQRGEVRSIDELPTRFAKQVSAVVDANGIGTMAAWQDGIKHANGPQDFSTRNVMVSLWDTIFWGASDSARDLSAKGYRTVLALPDYLYFDFPYTRNPRERGYYWGSQATDEYKVFSLAPDNLPQNAEVIGDRDGNPFEVTGTGAAPRLEGIQGQAWGEVMRNDRLLEYMAYPRLLALAERAWHKADWELPYAAGVRYKLGDTHHVDIAALQRDWAGFATLLTQRELPKLERAGIGYRKPTFTLTNE